MRIVIPTLGFGRAGGNRVLSELASCWTEAGHRVEFFANHSSAAPYFPTTAAIRWLDDRGSQVSSSASAEHQGRSGPGHVLRIARSLWGGLNRYARDADIILANHSISAWPVFACRSRARKFYYVQAYEPELYETTAQGAKPLLKFASWLSYHFPLTRIVNAPIYLSYKNLRAKAFVPPGIDLNIFQPKEKIPEGILNSITLGCIGRREPDKGISYVIDAYKLLHMEGRAVNLRVAYGNIPDEAAALPGVSIVKPSNDSELAAYYRSVDVIIAPALVQHGAPHYPVMEAMASATSVITTGYLPATVENAWIVPIKDPKAIAASVSEVAQNPELRLDRIRKGLRSVSELSWQTVSNAMLTHFEGSGAKPSAARVITAAGSLQA